MKKIALLALCAAPVMAGTPIITPAPAPAPAPAVSPWAIEIGAIGNLANRNINHEGITEAIDTYGADLTGIYNITENHAITLRFSYAYGSEVIRYNFGPEEDFSVRGELTNFSIMPGYRYTTAVTDKLSAFAGASIGFTHERLTGIFDREEKDSANDWGLGYAAEIGVSYALCPKTALYAAVQYSGNSASHGKFDTKKQSYTGLRVGVNYKF